MSTPAHDSGDQRRMTGLYVDIAGDPADPTGATLTIREPDGTQVVKDILEMQNPAVGTLYYDHTIPAKPGRHVYRFEGTGAVTTAGENEFWVRHRNAGP